MSERTKSLLVDIGNTRIKYASMCADPNKINTSYCQDVNALLAYLHNVAQITVASVQNELATNTLTDYCKQNGIRLRHVNTEAVAFDIHCAYSEYANLGVDRWLAILGARLHTEMPVGIIDVGTAATFDLVVENQHMGGWIAPGFELMKHSVTNNTSRVFANEQLPDSLALGDGTAQCVNLGCLAMLEGFVFSAIEYMQKHHSDFKIYVCGGNANMIEHMFSDKLEYKPHIVLQGLSRFS